VVKPLINSSAVDSLHALLAWMKAKGTMATRAMAEHEAHSQHALYAQEIAEERIADLPIVSEDLRKAKLKAAQAIRESLADTKPNR
jgi:hypothetical protein